MGLLSIEDEMEEVRKALQSVGVTEEDVANQKAADIKGSLLAAESAVMAEPQEPVSPRQIAKQEHGSVGYGLKSLLTKIPLLTPSFVDDMILPEMSDSNWSQYSKDYDQFEKDSKIFEKSREIRKALAGIDPENLTPEHIALGNEYAGSAFSDYLTDAYAAQQNAEGGDAEIAKHFGYSPYQWSQLSPEKMRDLGDRYSYEVNGKDAFTYRQYADNSAPEQIQAKNQAESEGTGRGNEITADRQAVTGIRRQIKGIDEGASMLTDVRDLIATRQADPGKFATGMRNLFGVETREDGIMSATAAQGVIDQLRDVTLGAISESELKLLLGGLLDPSRSPEANLGTIDTALKRMASNKKLAIDDARLAWGRLEQDEGQAGFLSQASEDDWYFNNLGEGKSFVAVPKADGSGEVTFSQYSENVRRNFKAQNPYADPPTREELIIGFNEFREQQRSLWEKAEEQRRQDAERLELAKKGLTETPLIFQDAGNP